MEKRFSEFVLVAENAEAVRGARVDTAREGSYQLLGDVLTRFSDHCTNTGKRRRRKRRGCLVCHWISRQWGGIKLSQFILAF